MWWRDAAKRQHHITHLEHVTEAMFREAVSFLHMWKGEIAADALDAEHAA